MTERVVRVSLHQQHRAAALNLAGDFPMHVCRHPGYATWKNFATFSDEFFEEIGILVIDCFEGNIDPAPRHWTIGATERGTAFWRFWLHQTVTWSRGATCVAAET